MNKKRWSALALAAAMVFSAACAAETGTTGATDETAIVLSDSGITVNGKAASTDESAAVYVGADIIYYQDGTDASYGAGSEADMHTAAEAAEHTVVTITEAGTYRLSGTLSKGQIAIDLGKGAKDDETAVVTVILDGADVTCTVAPALIFYNVYECDREFVAYDNDENPDYESTPIVDTSKAGANVILAAGSENNFTGSHVAKIYKEGTTKKRYKFDGAFYSKMSMNIFGDNGDDSGVLNIIADNEGLDSELHLTLNGGTVNITAQDDGINTNEDLISVTTVNGGFLTVNAGLGAEGDGIDSNGHLVINGGTVWTMANPQTPDGGIDADGQILINGGTLYAFGTRNDASDRASEQPFMELQFASTLPAGTEVELKDGEGNTIWSATTRKACQSITLSCEELALNTAYSLYVDGVLQCYSGNSFGMGRPMGGFGGGNDRPDGRQDAPQKPEGGEQLDADMLQPGDMTKPAKAPWERGEGQNASQGEFDFTQIPEDFDPANFDPNNFDPKDMDFGGFGGDEGFGVDHGGFGGHGGGFGGMFGDSAADASGETEFILTESSKSFSGVCDSEASGKTRVSFTIGGAERVGRNTVLTEITAITPSAEVDAAQVQITVTDDPSEDYAATCLLSDGLEAVNALLPTADGNYTLTVSIVSGNEAYTGASQISFVVGALPFTDLNRGQEGYDAVKTLYQAGIMQGVGGNRFAPEMTVTRAQAVAAIFRMMDGESVETGKFRDVPADAWYAEYVGWATETGAVEGDGNGHFYPEMTVTAEQLTLMLERLGKTVNTDLSGELNRLELAEILAAAL